MTNELGTAVLKLKTDDSEFDAGIERAHQKSNVLGLSLDRVSNIAGGMLTRDVIREGFSRFQELLGSTIDSANESAKVQAQLQAAIKSTGGAAGESLPMLEAQAKAFQDTTTFSDEAVGSVQGLLLTFTDIKSNIFPQATQTVLDMATAMHEDLQSAAIQVGKALQDPILGATQLRRVGVQLSDSQQQLVKDLVASGDKLGAQKVIMAELNKEFGGSAAAQVDTYAGKMAQLGNKIDDVKEEIGFTIQGGLMTLFDWIQQHQDDIGDFFDKWMDRLAPVVEYFEVKLGAIISYVKDVYKTVSDVVDLFDSLVHGDWQSVWEDAKKIPVDLMHQMVDEIALMFGNLPKIMAEGVQAGINAVIDVINKAPTIKTPDLGPLGGPRTIFGGFDIGHVDIVSALGLDTFTDKYKNITKDAIDTVSDAQKQFADRAKNAKPPIAALASAYSDSGDAAAKAGPKISDMIQEALGKVRSVVSALFAQPTREVANLQLQSDKLQYKADQIQMRLQPSIDKLNELKDGITEAADKAKEALQVQKDAIDAAREMINATQDALSERGSQLDQIHQQMQDAIKARFEPPKKMTPEERALAIDTQQFNAAKKQNDDMIKANERQLKALDANSKQLDKASKAVDDNTAKETKLIDTRIRNYQKEIDAANKQVQLVQEQIKLHGDEKKIMQDILTLADRTLLSEQEQRDAFQVVKQRVGDLSQGILDMVGGVRKKLIPGFDDLVKAHGPFDLLSEKAQKAAASLDKVKAPGEKPSSGSMWTDLVNNTAALFPSHASGWFASKPQLGIIGDSPGGEWVFNRSQLTSLIRDIKRPESMGDGVSVHLPNATIYASTREEAEQSLNNLGLAFALKTSKTRRGGMA